MSECEHPSCERKGEERVYRGHYFFLCKIHFDELKSVSTKFERMKIEDESETQRRTREYDEARSGDMEE